MSVEESEERPTVDVNLESFGTWLSVRGAEEDFRRQVRWLFANRDNYSSLRVLENALVKAIQRVEYSLEMLSLQTDIPMEKIDGWFLNA